jgi:SAM-dependent methyltransferase
MLTPTASQSHLLALCNTMLKRGNLPSTVRILDMGCGDAHMLAYLARTLPPLYKDRNFEFYGFEVGDIGWQSDNYLERTIEFLHEQAPGYSWKDRIGFFSASDSWPYQSGSFDVIISNQVFEHVQQHALVFGEIRRCLTPGGVSIHLFPLHETIYEVHAHMPFVHWIRQSGWRQKLMLAFARLGLTRKYKEEMHFRGWRNLKEFAATYSAVLGSMTNYKSSEQITALAEKAGLTAEFSYTKNFFSTKLLSMFKRNPGCYALPSWIDAATFPILKRLASITLILRQREVGQRRNPVQSVSS